MWLDPGGVDGGLGRCLLLCPDLPLLGEDGAELATGGAADGVPVFCRVVGPARADSIWVAAAAAAVLFSAHLRSGAIELPLCSLREWHRRRPRPSFFGIVLLGYLGIAIVVRVIPLDRMFVPLGRFLRLEGVKYGRGSRHGRMFSRGN